uniref:Uncharacterized protein n=1 Tax=viral metagenome TaxID=1070528 RepID=A0A6C0H801_9ZZZZ
MDYSKLFFSKETITFLKNDIITKSKILNINFEHKENRDFLLNIIINHMKTTFKSLDLTKITDTNINHILTQFKNHVINLILEYIKKNKNLFSTQPKNELSFNNKNNIPIDRPINSRSISQKVSDIDNTESSLNFNNIQQQRQSEMGMPFKPPTPDFLKPIQVKTKNNSYDNEKQLQPIQEFTNELETFSFDSENLYSLDNFNKPIIENNIIEDNSSFNDRLKKLQSDRNIILLNQNNSQQNNSIPEINSIDNINNNQPNNYHMQPVQSQTYINPIENNTQPNDYNIQPLKSQNYINPIENNRVDDYINNTDINTNNNQINSNDLINLQLIMKNNQDTIKIIYNELLAIQNNISNNYNLMDKFKIKLKEEYQYLQLEIFNIENKSEYTWTFDNMITNIISIQLISYSIPQSVYNIQNNINNIFKILIGNEESYDEFEILIEEGKYTIEELINYINNKLDDGGEVQVILKLDNDQKISIVSNETIKLVINFLLDKNLGFSTCDNFSNIHKANNIWDLRLKNKIYLYLNNISNNIPFGILYFNQNFNSPLISNFTFESPINLNTLDIIFKDEYNYIYNFNNLFHNLNFIIKRYYD